MFHTTESHEYRARRLLFAALGSELGDALTKPLPPEVSRFAARERYADSLEILRKSLGAFAYRTANPGIVINSGGPFAAYRMALCFKAIDANGYASRRGTTRNKEGEPRFTLEKSSCPRGHE